MELVEDKHTSNFIIKRYSSNTIFFTNDKYDKPIIFYCDTISQFSICHPSEIRINDIEKYLSTVSVILIGTGERSILLNETLIFNMQTKNKGLEFMNTESACKTHNLLLSEKRSFASILYP